MELIVPVFGIVDLFAGPGGLSEGFTAASSERGPFKIGVSIEKERSAHRTLTLRSFIREHLNEHGCYPTSYVDFHSGLIDEPDWSTICPASWRRASEETLCLELGQASTSAEIEKVARRLRKQFDDLILIGGPPCQAYSLVGRARSKGNADYVPELDNRHYLFREYIRVLDKLRPAVFVLENVKGMLSSTVDARLVFEMLIEDLSSLCKGKKHLYELRAITTKDGIAKLKNIEQASDFIVRAEDFGVPQKRHRVIIIGVRSDLVSASSNATLPLRFRDARLSDAIGDLPALRSGLSRGKDDELAWQSTVVNAADLLSRTFRKKQDQELRNEFESVSQKLKETSPLLRSSDKLRKQYGRSNNELLRWLERPGLKKVAQHETRGHMASDLGRYLFAAVFGKVHGYSPKASEFPSCLKPDHQNWQTGIFDDRFRVQLTNEPSTTITSHIAKDGHYFIHPDPQQCRSLTVREAARLQTFPDDYYFLGNRTQQYVQIGNAVPPLLAKQIAELLKGMLNARS